MFSLSFLFHLFLPSVSLLLPSLSLSLSLFLASLPLRVDTDFLQTVFRAELIDLVMDLIEDPNLIVLSRVCERIANENPIQKSIVSPLPSLFLSSSLSVSI
jgi:hypothetical protein